MDIRILESDWIAIQKSVFWQEFMAMLEARRKEASRHCETDGVDVIPKYQGRIEAYDFVKTFPEKILQKFGKT